MGGLLIGATTTAIESFLRGRKVPTRFSLAMMLTIIAGACVLLAIQRLVPLATFALHLVPNCVVMLCLACVCFFVASRVRRIVTARAEQG